MAAKKTTTADKSDAVIEGEVIPPTGGALTVAPGLDAFMKQVLPPKNARELSDVLPEHISWDLFKRNLWNALAANVELRTSIPAILFREVSKAAGLGLLLDPLLGEAYLIVGYNGKTKQKEPQLRIGYKGLMKLARQSGNVAGMWAHEVCENDIVVADLGHPKVYSHKPVLFGDRGPVIGYTAVVSYKDGTFDFEPMSKADCLAIRDRSDAWKAYKAEKIASTPWQTDEIEMSKKTVINRLMKRQDKSPEMRDAIEIENAAEFPEMSRMVGNEPVDHTPARKITPPAPPEDDGTAPSSRDLSAERSKAAPRGDRNEPKQTAGQEFAAAYDQATENLGKKTTPKMSTKELLIWIDGLYCEVTPEVLDERPDIIGSIWEEQIAPKLDGLFPPDIDAAQAIRREHEKRLEP